MSELNDTVKQLVEALQKKKEYMEKLKTLSLKQREAINNEDIERLNRLLESKNRLISEIDMIDKENNGLSVENEKEGLEKTGSLHNDIENLAREIYDIDQKNMELANNIRDELKKSLKDLDLHRKSRDAYAGKNSKLSGVFLNKEK